MRRLLVLLVLCGLGGGPAHVMTVGQLLGHAANHGVHHRGQVALLLRMAGHAPGNIDLLMFYARPEAAPLAERQARGGDA